MFGASPNDMKEAQNSFKAIWSTDDIPASPPLLGNATLGKALAAVQLEHDRRYQVLRAREFAYSGAKGPDSKFVAILLDFRIYLYCESGGGTHVQTHSPVVWKTHD